MEVEAGPGVPTNLALAQLVLSVVLSRAYETHTANPSGGVGWSVVWSVCHLFGALFSCCMRLMSAMYNVSLAGPFAARDHGRLSVISAFAVCKSPHLGS